MDFYIKEIEKYLEIFFYQALKNKRQTDSKDKNVMIYQNWIEINNAYYGNLPGFMKNSNIITIIS